MRKIESYKPLSQTSQDIINKFKAEFNKGQNINAVNLTPTSAPDFIKMTQEMLNLGEMDPNELADAILPREFLWKNLKAIRTEGFIQGYYPDGHIIQLAVIPFTYSGHRYKKNEIEQGIHFVELLQKDPEGKSTGASPYPSYAHKLLPNEFQRCEFKIPEYKYEFGDFIVSPIERDNIRRVYVAAFDKLKSAIIKAAEEAANR